MFNTPNSPNDVGEPDTVISPVPAPEHVRAPSAEAAIAPRRPRAPLETVEDEIVYKRTARGKLSLHVVRPKSGAAPAAGRPCVVFFHGGGWRRGTPRQMLPIASLLAQRGIVGISAEYRLIEDLAQAIPGEGIADARSALRWVRSHAGAFGIDPTRIGAGGGSAGAHLALMATLGDAGLDDPADDVSIPLKPAALLLLNAPLDFDGYDSDIPVAERHRYSPHHLLTKDLPPTLLFHGTRDKVIPYEQVIAFEKKARELGAADVRVSTFEGRGHGFFNRGKGEPGDFLRVAKEMVAFLRQQGWDS